MPSESLPAKLRELADDMAKWEDAWTSSVKGVQEALRAAAERIEGQQKELSVAKAMNRFHLKLAEVRLAALSRARTALLEIRAGEYCPNLDTQEKRQGLGCGIEDRDIVDRYEAAEYGYDDALERYQFTLNAVIDEALNPVTLPGDPAPGECPAKMEEKT